MHSKRNDIVDIKFRPQSATNNHYLGYISISKNLVGIDAVILLLSYYHAT